MVNAGDLELTWQHSLSEFGSEQVRAPLCKLISHFTISLDSTRMITSFVPRPFCMGGEGKEGSGKLLNGSMGIFLRGKCVGVSCE